LRKWIAKQLDLPEDVMMNLPRLTMVGQIHLYIENHRGLLSFSDSEIRVRLIRGQLLVKGSSLVIKAILPEELLLEGMIEHVIFIQE